MYIYVYICIYMYIYKYICMLWLIPKCALTQSYVSDNSIRCVSWLIAMCAIPHFYIFHDSLICVTWLNPPYAYPPAPINHVKYLRAGPAEMPVQNWYTDIQIIKFVRRKSKTQLGWVINLVPQNFVRRIRSWRTNCLEQDLKYFYWTICKSIFWNLFTCKGTWMIDWVGRIYMNVYVFVTRMNESWKT